MKLSSKISILFLVSFILFPCLVSAKYQVDLTPTISVGEQYDDNINLERENEIRDHDYITTITPSFDLHIVSERDNIAIRYSPSIVRYREEDQYNTVRHSGTLSLNTELGARLTFTIADTYLKTEEPIEETEGIIGLRRTRNSYQRNTGNAGIIYAFGPENTLTFGYNHSLLEN
jgi:uncharacterized protein (PEP-CTERM system associated)